MFTRMNFELKVGIFIFIGIVILSVIIFSIGNFYSVKRGYNLDVVFSFANGIGVGAPVRYSGVQVGEVQEIKIYFDENEKKPLVKLTVWVSQDTWINENAKASINTLGLLGEKYLEISPGTRDVRLLQKGDVLRGSDPVSTEELARGTKELIEKIANLTESLNKIAGDDSLRASLKTTFNNIEALSGDLRDFLSSAKQGKGTIGRLMSDDMLYKHTDELILDIKEHPWKLLFKPPESRKKK
ncbi:MAG: MlaD family protein [Candidatus Omnitrophica bacterium]|nr:MlaD family protein [Candidatus Omnitrophota bacterium]